MRVMISNSQLATRKRTFSRDLFSGNARCTIFNFQFRAIFFGLLLFLSCNDKLNAQEMIPKWKITELEEYIAKSDTPIVINFWATYCIPCLKEIPYFEETIKKHNEKKNNAIKLLLVSLDFKEEYDKIRNFADKRKFKSPVVWLDETNADYFCPKIDAKWSGVMPATLFINNKNGHRSFFEEEIPKDKFESEVKKMLDNQ